MVNADRPSAARRHRRRLVLGAALVAALLLSSCEFLGLDIFPSTLQNAAGSINLDARIKGQDGAAIGYVQEIERLTSSATGTSYLFVLCSTDLGMRLIVLNPESLATVAYFGDSGIGTPLASVANGNFVSGAALIDGGFTISPNTYASLPGKMVVATATPTNLVLSSSGGVLSYDERSSDWSTSNDANSKRVSAEYAYYLVDAAAPSDGTLRLLFHNDGSRELELTFSSIANFTAAVSASTPTNLSDWVAANPTLASATKLPDAPDSRSWLCARGIVAPSYSNNSRLVRYGYGTGAALDSRIFEGDWVRGLSFDYDEKGWYYYDSHSGQLYSMRTWW